MPRLLMPQRVPIFVPRVTSMDATRLTAFAVPRPFELVQVLGSALLSASPALLSAAHTASAQFYVDPDTERLAFPIVVSRTQSLQALLAQFRENPALLGALDLAWLSAHHDTFTDNVIAFQRNYAPFGIQAPSFSFANSSDAWFTESVYAAHRTAAALANDESLIVQISAQANAITAAHDRAAIIAAYRELPVTMFVLQIAHDDEKSAPIADAAYIDLVTSLSRQAPVIASKVGFFGFVCVANGAAGSVRELSALKSIPNPLCVAAGDHGRPPNITSTTS